MSTPISEPQYTTLVLPLQIHYRQYQHGLKDVTLWNRSRIDTDLISLWLADCQQHHGPCCNELLDTSPLPHDFRLIDTAEWCVKKLDAEKLDDPDEYLALSYVWAAASEGNPHNPFQLLSTSIGELEMTGSLRNGPTPKIIKDAIQLCADLGFRFLWVDRLCIVQDGGAAKAEQINAMDAIYHRATVTIVALDACPGVGLPGVSSRPRQTTPSEKLWNLDIDGDAIGATAPTIHFAVSGSPWNQRGWTYQERLLSRRHLFIDQNHFYLNCFRSRHESDGLYENSYREEAGTETGNNSGHGYEQGMRKKTDWPDWYDSSISRYSSAAHNYTCRELSYDEDTLNAFMGVGNMFGSQHGTSLLFGLPERFLFQALLWRHEGPWRQRQLSNSVTMPSWSWASWNGAITYDRVLWCFAGLSYSVEVTSESHMGSLVKFYYVDPIKGIRAIDQVELWFQRRGLEISADSRELPSQCAQIIRDIPSTRFMSLDGEASLQLWQSCVQNPWNVPTYSGMEAVEPVAPGSLIFSTTFAFLKVEEPPPDSATSEISQSDEPYTCFLLVDEGGNEVGQSFRMSRKEALQTLHPGKAYGVAVLGASVTSRKASSNGKDPWGLIVMIIDRQDGISRRLGLGAVNPPAWTKLQPTWETIVLS